MRPHRILLLFGTGDDTLSYQQGWVRAFLQHPRFDCVPIDVRSRSLGTWLGATRGGRFDAVIYLHSSFWPAEGLRAWAKGAVARLARRSVYFIGNEYKLMPQKIAFCERIGVDLLVSQLNDSCAHELYERRLGCRVAPIPGAGLDVDVFRPETPTYTRPIDLGYRAFEPPWSLGHRERQTLALDVPTALAGSGLVLDVSLDPKERFNQAAWAAFLNRCKGQLGSEAGGDYFELTDATRITVDTYVEEHPDVTFDAVFERFFREYPDPVPGRALSGRIVEAAGTKTIQILFDGDYGGFFLPDVHYIALEKNLSNLADAIERFRDMTYARALADAAYEVAVSELTYSRLIDRFADELETVL